MTEGSAPFAADRPRYFVVYSRGTGEIRELGPPPWDSAQTSDLRYYGRAFKEMERYLHIPNLRFYITWDTGKLPEYGANVVVLLLGEEIGRIPQYARHVGAVLKTMAIAPFLGIRQWIPFDRVRLALLIKHLRNLVLYAHSRVRAIVALHAIPLPPVLDRPYVLQTPLGCYKIDDLPIKPMKDRPFHAFFAGQIHSGKAKRPGILTSPKNFARLSMLDEAIALSRRNPEFKFDYRVTDNASSVTVADLRTYSQRLMDSKICLAPRGSVAETWRFFEGLKYGCLVVCEPLPDRTYYGGAPVIQIDSWSQLGQVVAPFLKDDDALEAWSRRSLNYYNEVCGELPIGRRIAEFIQQSPALRPTAQGESAGGSPLTSQG